MPRYQGKCKQKKWRWRESKETSHPPVEKGESLAVVWTLRQFPEAGDLQTPEGVAINWRGNVIELRTEKSEVPKVAKKRYESLREFVQSLDECDKAILVNLRYSKVKVLKCPFRSSIDF